MSSVVERFLNYVAYDTKSDEESKETPSTSGQLVLAGKIADELCHIGLSNVSVDDNGYVMATIPSNVEGDVPTVGFVAHMDTAPDISGKDVSPRIIDNYDGKEIVLDPANNIVLSPEDFPDLKKYIGETLITTNGHTLLGADDKAGVAEIITAMEYLIAHPEIKHGTLRICFTPDEEIGRGADHFDVKKFDADFAYTLDGGELGQLEFENFNAAAAIISIHGRNVHPGTAKDQMINSIYIASELISLLPQDEVPEKTEGYDGFYHLTSFRGEVEKTTLKYIIRDFDKHSFNTRKEKLREIIRKIDEKHGNGTISLELRDQYYNMREMIEPVKYVVDIAQRAIEETQIKPLITPVRGGTDGARLSYMGLPTPNIFTGGHNFHSKFEFIPVFAMEKAVKVIIRIAEHCAETQKDR